MPTQLGKPRGRRRQVGIEEQRRNRGTDANEGAGHLGDRTGDPAVVEGALRALDINPNAVAERRNELGLGHDEILGAVPLAGAPGCRPLPSMAVLTKDAPVENTLDRPSPGAAVLHRRVAIALVVVAGLVVRWWLSSTRFGYVNDDEAMSAVSAFDVLHGHPHLVIGASNYGGTLEALILAPLLKLFGAHVWLLRVVATATFATAVVVVGSSAKQLFDRRVSWVAGGLLWLASAAMVLISMTVYLGYNTGLFFTALALSLCMRVAKGEQPRRLFFAAGVSAGLAIWGHPLYIVPLLPAMLALMWLRRAELRFWFLALAGGSLVGLSPFLAWNAMNRWASILHNPAPIKATTYTERLQIVFAQLLPRAFGLRGEQGDWLYPRRLGMIAMIVLLIAIHAGLIVLARRSRAGVVAAASGLLAIPFVAAFPALFWYADARYAVVLMVPWMLGLTVWVELLVRRRRAASVWAAAIVLLFGLASTGKWIKRHARTQVDANAASVQIVKALDARGIQGVAGRYWIVYRVAFFSNDRIAAHVPPAMGEGDDRSMRSANQVLALPASKVAYMGWLPDGKTGYTKENVGGVDIYFPS